MTRELRCERCGTLVATLRDASVRKGIVVYCANCAKPKPEKPADMPDFMRRFFEGTK